METPNSAPATKLSLYEFACSNKGSARLRNSLESASALGQLPFTTIADYLAAPAPMETLRSSVRSLGRRTAMELDRMVRDFSQASGVQSQDDAPPEELVTLESEQLRQKLDAISLRALLDQVPSGSRLYRVMRSEVGDCSVLMAVDDSLSLRSKVLSVSAVGGGTADELAAEVRLGVSRLLRRSGLQNAMHDALMVSFFGSDVGPCWRGEQSEDDKDPASGLAEDIVRRVLGERRCADAFVDVVVPVRLSRLVRAVGDRLMADAMLERIDFDWELTRVPNVGRKTIVEFWERLWRCFAVIVARSEVTGEDRSSIAKLLGVEPTLLDAHPEDLAEHGPLVPSDEETADRVIIPRSLDNLIDFLLERIKSQDAPIVRRRFGLDGGAGETLEEIGSDLGVTRERIRQLEKRGLADLKVLARKVDLRGALDADWSRAWNVLADGDDLVTELEFATFRRSMPGSLTLALEILGVELQTWLSAISHRYPHGWLAPQRDREPVQAAIIALDGLPEDLPLPRALSELGLPGSPSDVEAALLVGRGLRTLHGYLVAGRIGTRRRRSLIAHALLARVGTPMSLSDLQRAYHEATPADPCSTRDLTIVMSDAPHLFLEVSEWRWASIGAGGEIPPGGRPREVDAVEDVLLEMDLTVAAAIRDELARTGPQPLSSLIDRPKRYLPPERSHNSVQPTLIMRPDLFARLLPGVYGLWSQIPSRDEVLAGDVPYLLDEQQARIFAMSRRAGESWGAYPLWSPEAEYRLCRWAMREGSSDVRRSLLATATVDVWPLEASERDQWRGLCARDGRYDLVGTVRPGVFGVRPDLDRLLAALIDLETNGRTSWMALNRVDGRHVGSQMGCGLLAVLLLIGAALPPDQSAESAWQLSHHVRRQDAREMREALSAELHNRGTLDWRSDAGRLVASRILAGEDRSPTWLPFHRFAELFQSTGTELTRPVEITPDVAVEAGRALLAERRMSDLLDWLDGQ